MMFSGLADDQIALIGCACAVFVCGGLMSLSHFLRPQGVADAEADHPATLAFPQAAAKVEKREERRAA